MERIFEFKTLFDSHSHFGITDLSKDEMVSEALKNGVMKIVDVANDYESSINSLKNFNDFPNVILPTIGIHPELVIPGSEMFNPSMDEKEIDEEVLKLKNLLDSNPSKFIMIGEIGIDYYWLEKSLNLKPEELERSKTLQKYLFESQLKLAVEYNLPLTIHARSSYSDCIEIVKKYIPKVKGIFHSFTGTLEEAKKIKELGFSIGINGIITYKSAVDLRNTLIELMKGIKITTQEDLYNNGIYLETDSPFLFPSNVAERKKFNSPYTIKFIWEFVYNLLNQ